MSYKGPDSEERHEEPDTEQAMLEIVRSLRENPDKYRSMQTALKSADSDEERVNTLIKFATDERELAALMPARARGRFGQTELAWTTVTVTTVLILESTAE
jgi:hypothetical protein